MKLANKPGRYKNFSGEVKWKKSTVCKVRNADFELLEKDDDKGKEIIFDDAVFVSGKAHWCIVRNGLNLGCDFTFCRIDYMINRGGGIFDCDWHDGIFEGGIFERSIWDDGIWIKGVWDRGKNSIGDVMELTPDKW